MPSCKTCYRWYEFYHFCTGKPAPSEPDVLTTEERIRRLEVAVGELQKAHEGHHSILKQLIKLLKDTARTLEAVKTSVREMSQDKPHDENL